ncbi:MAG: hypothetical protein DLM72_17055 [Candidatus Nitrosopolaris wilkensis]|nr:MAG: hypothetical protein DLM72_17055 [Candidatus Nitrosopolaris wilkensis]
MALNVLIVKNAVAIVIIGSLVLFASILVLISQRFPAPPPPIAYIQILQTAGVILAVSGALVFVLEIRKSHLRLKKAENSGGT